MRVAVVVAPVRRVDLTRLPEFRIATRVKNGGDLNLVSCDLIKNSEGKTPNDGASKISVDDRVEIGSASHTQQRFFNTFHKLNVQIFALAGVPVGGLDKFGFRVGGEPNEHVRLTRLHEFSLDLFPRSALSGIAFG